MPNAETRSASERRALRLLNAKPSASRTIGQPTIVKARVLGGKQQIVRLDYEQKLMLSESNLQQYEQKLQSLFPLVSLVVISDYGKGLISESLCQFLIHLAQSQNIPVIVDPKGKNWQKYHGATLVTPNVKELGDITGFTIPNEDKAIEEAARKILTAFRLGSLLVTRSEKGMSLISTSQTIHIPTRAEEVFDVSGAGDTVVATLSLALASGNDIKESMHMANTAAGIVVRKIGTATLTREELEVAL